MKKIIAICLTFFICGIANAQMAKFQALYIYNFAKNTSWPAEDNSKELTITVIGDNDVVTELSDLAKTKGVGTRKVIIKQAAASNNVTKSDIIYLGESKSNQLGALVAAQASNKTLIVCGKKGLCSSGADISFVSEGGKLNYEISPKNIQRHGLSVSQKIISLGTDVD
ncbi:MAG: YfiR family protein [Bacteroidales bacterium]|nr:YfiR family protein [Bacteroidales bacterium]